MLWYSITRHRYRTDSLRLPRWLAIVTLMVLVLLGGSVHVVPVAGQEHPDQWMTLADQGYETMTVRGILSVADFWMPGAGPVELDGDGTFRLHYAHTDTLTDGSTLTVRLNGHDIASAPLTPDDTDDKWLDVSLPTDLLQPAFNNLQVVFYLRYDTRQPCTDPNNPSLWATVYPDSALHYDTGAPRDAPAELDLASYPAPFYHDDLGPEPALHLVLPSAPDETVLTAAASMVGRLGQVTRGRTVHPVLHMSDTPPEMMAIVVGTADAIPWLVSLDQLPLRYDPAEGHFLHSDDTPIASDAGILQLVSHRTNSGRTVPLLLVTGAGEEGVRRAGLTLASDSFSSLLHGRYAILTEPPTVDELMPEATRAGRFTFGDLTGQETDPTLRGSGRHFVNVPFTMPQSWQFDDRDPRVTVHFSHAVGLDDRSLLTVEVNGSAIGSVRLKDDIATDERITLTIPPSVLRAGRNALAVTFDMRPADHTPCDFEFDDVAWGTVHRDSTLEMPITEEATIFDLDTFAAPFVRDGAVRDTTLVPSSLTDQQVISQTLSLALQLGRRTTSDVVQVPVRSLPDPDDIPDNHLILIGPPDNSPLMTELAPRLPLQFDEMGMVQWQEDGAGLLAVRNEEPIGILQMGMSPWGGDRYVLQVSGTTPEAVGWAVAATGRESLHGIAVSVTRDGRIASVSLTPERSNERPSKRRLPTIATVAVGLAVASIVVATVILSLRRRRINEEMHRG